jgi:ribonuclease HI
MKKNFFDKIVVYTDGGSRGNPGPAAIGVYIETLDKKYSQFLGKTTNNIAEYKAIIFALKKIKSLIGSEKSFNTEIEIRSDSNLIVNQLNGKYKIKEKSLFEYFVEIWNLKQEYKKVSFVYVPREKNKVADALLNETLNYYSNPKKSLF